MGEFDTYYKWHEFDFDEKVDLKQCKCYMVNVPYSVPIRKPLGHWTVIDCGHLQTIAAERFRWPGSQGIQWKSIKGLLYLGVQLTTEEQAKQRAPIYSQRIKPYIDDFEGKWRGENVPELEGHIERLKRIDVKKVDNGGLRDHLMDWLSTWDRVNQIHFELMGIVNPIYKLFSATCQELLGFDENSPQFKALMGGFENKAFEVDRGLFKLADRAKELGLEPTFQAIPDNEQLFHELGGTKAGKEWLRELDEFLYEYGWRCERLNDASIPTWVEKPATLVLPAIRANIAAGGVFGMDRAREELVRKRGKAEKDTLSRIPEDRRESFGRLMRAAQWAGRWSEEHGFYIDFAIPALGRPLFMEIGRRATEAGILDDPDDINFLFPHTEIARILPGLRLDLRERVQIRRKQWKEFTDGLPKMLAEKFAIGDQSALTQWGVDPIVAVVASIPVVKPELKADLYGAASSVGVAQGEARVILSESQLSEIKTGDILVTQATNSFFTPFFGLLKAVVTDGGGMLSHAAIVTREYGIPAVVGTVEATRKIKTGMRIRVDGNNGVVYILD